MYKKLFSIFFITTVFFSSCSEDEECRQSRFVRLRVGFHEMRTDVSTGITSSERITIDSLNIQFANVQRGLARASRIELELNKLDSLSQFIFAFTDTTLNITVRDTVSVFYEIHEEFLSFQCGILHTFTLDSARTSTTRHFLDSIVISSTEVNNISNAENIKLYRRPR
jgi:hypothetical protein